MKLYKYTDAKGLAILRDLTVKASRASEFNDPFELSPKIDASQFSRGKIRKALLEPERVESWYRLVKARGLVQNKKTFKKDFRRMRPELIQNVLADLPGNVEHVRQDFAQMFDCHWRIFCVSKIRHSILMWSHYADKHKGLVVEFDTAHPSLASWGDESCLEVEYLPQKADFVFEARDSTAFERRLFAVARRKSPEWEYEQEVRYILPAPSDGGVLFPIEPGAITGVIVGARASAELMDEVCRILSQPHFSHVTLERAVLSKDMFALEFVRLDPRLRRPQVG